MATYLLLGMCQVPPLLDDIRRHDGEREVDDRQNPKSAPILCHLRKARTQLIDADNAIDREVDREDIASNLRRPGHRFAWPGEPREEELRQAGGEEDEGRRLRTLKPRTDRLG